MKDLKVSIVSGSTVQKKLYQMLFARQTRIVYDF